MGCHIDNLDIRWSRSGQRIWEWKGRNAFKAKNMKTVWIQGWKEKKEIKGKLQGLRIGRWIIAINWKGDVRRSMQGLKTWTDFMKWHKISSRSQHCWQVWYKEPQWPRDCWEWVTLEKVLDWWHFHYGWVSCVQKQV